MGDITEKVDIVINESGGRTVKRSLDDIADSAQRGVQPLGVGQQRQGAVDALQPLHVHRQRRLLPGAEVPSAVAQALLADGFALGRELELVEG